MQGLPLQCKNLQEQVKSILQLIQQEPFFRSDNVTSIQSYGHVTIDTPGIANPVEKDSHFAYARIGCSDTSSVICVLKSASVGDMTKEETELLEKIGENSGIRDRVFYLFNRIGQHPARLVTGRLPRGDAKGERAWCILIKFYNSIPRRVLIESHL
ncbi:hypothetical protein WA1_44980 [Scytonema hofmannii PCC 7110]|uniref:Uncharacterized protein n=1 Tax=Scytonema hofmannii PCC 7110 TaxID=128403 RepID=A0A139WWK9_9CYAN|nr:hypothetical protein WA1_44980 [Scytonema hofmannii PCC 7110]